MRLLYLLIFLASCSFPSTRRAPEVKLDIEIDTLFITEERKELIKAIAEWRNAADGRIEFGISWRDTSGDKGTYNNDNRHVIYSPRGPWQTATAMEVGRNPCIYEICIGMTIWETGGGCSDIFILTKDIGTIRSITAHELGHMMGLEHNNDNNSIMYRSVAPDGRISSGDERTLKRVLDDGKFPQPCRIK